MLKPRHNNLLVKPYEKPEKSEGGLWLPDDYRKDQSGYLFDVIAVGPGKLTWKGVRVPCECKVNDIIHLESRWVVQEMPVDSNEQKLYIVNEDHVAAIIWRDK